MRARMELFGRNQIHAALRALARLVHVDVGMHRAGPDLGLAGAAIGRGVIADATMTAMCLRKRREGQGDNEAEEYLKDEFFHIPTMQRNRRKASKEPRRAAKATAGQRSDPGRQASVFRIFLLGRGT